MNEVSFTKLAGSLPASSASSTGQNASKSRASESASPNQAVKPPETEQPKAAKATPEELKSAVAVVNQYVQSVKRDLQFSVDEELDRTIIRVVDSDSGEVVRQIPEDIFLELARRLSDDGEFQLVNALG